jgi:protocatechuate 3,4-dioxygenase beta subunit
MTLSCRHLFWLAIGLFACRAAASAELIRGSVVDSVSRTGIASTSVQLKTSPSGALVDETATNEKGQFAFENVATGKYVLSAARDGYLAGAPVKVTVPEKDRPDVLLALVRAASIAGTVMDSAGRPARGAKVSILERRAEQGRARLAVVGFGAMVDDRGAYRLHDLAPGSYTLVVTPPMSVTGQASFAPLYYPGVVQSERAEWITLRPGEARAGMDLLLRETARYAVSGLVTGVPSDWPAQRISVALTPTDGFGTPIATVSADSAGRFRFAAVAPGSYEVTASGPVIGRAFNGPVLGQNPRQATRRIEVTSDEVRSVEISLGTGSTAQERPANAQTSDSKIQKGSIAGSVTDATGKTPLADATVHIMGKSSREARTDAKGRYELNDLDAGDYRLFVRKESYGWGVAGGPRRVRLAQAQHVGHIDFPLRKGATVSGRVLDEDRKPVAGATLLIRGAGYRDGKPSFNSQNSARTNDLGEYRFEDMPAGSYILSASPKIVEGHTRLSPKKDRPARIADIGTFYMNSPSVDGAIPLALTAGEQHEGVDLILPRAKTYCVSVSVPLSAKALRNTHMMLFDSGPGRAVIAASAKITGPEEMEMCGIAPGAYELYVTIGDGLGATEAFARSSFQVIDRHVELGSLQPVPRRALSGKVAIDGAEPGAQLPKGIRLAIQANGRISFMGEDFSAEVAPTGDFTIKHLFLDEYWVRLFGLPTGHYLKEARCGNQNPRVEPIRSDCGELQFVLASDAATVSGQAVDADNKPVIGATVVLAPASLPEIGLPGLIRTQETDQNGEFNLTGVAPGEYRLLAFTGLLPGEGEYPKFLRNHWTKAIELNVASRGAHRISPTIIPIESASRVLAAPSAN